MNFTIPGYYRLKIKESEKKDKFFLLARELKKLWNMKVTVIPIVVGTLGMVPKSLAKRLGKFEIRGRIRAIQHCLNQQGYLKDSWRPEKTCCHLEFHKKSLVKTGMKNSNRPGIVIGNKDWTCPFINMSVPKKETLPWKLLKTSSNFVIIMDHLILEGRSYLVLDYRNKTILPFQLSAEVKSKKAKKHWLNNWILLENGKSCGTWR